ncbi:MAG: hypothetical protein Q9186_003832 [Xanthomendoza sp. 1 TL-2023]
MGNMTSSMPEPTQSPPPLEDSVDRAGSQSHETHTVEPVPAATTHSMESANEHSGIESQARERFSEESRDRGPMDRPKNPQPLQLLELPLDILKDIVKEVTNTNDLTSLALTCSALNGLATPWIYSRFDIVWPDMHNNADSRQGVDALTYGLATLVMGENHSYGTWPANSNQRFYCRHCGGHDPVPADTFSYVTPQYTRKFSLGNGRDEWIKEYMINRESGKMLGTLIALAIARMPNLETFVWDMPTGILRDCWLALSQTSESKDPSSQSLEKVWVRFHDNSEIVATSDQSPRLPYVISLPLGTAFNPSQTQWSSAVKTPPTANRLAWSYRHVESPNFSCLPALRSLNVFDIDELAYLEEMSMLLERSIESLRELRVGLAPEVPRKGFTSLRANDRDFEDDTSELSTYEGALGLLLSKIYTDNREDGSANPTNHPGKAVVAGVYKADIGNTVNPIALQCSSGDATSTYSNGHAVTSDPAPTTSPNAGSANTPSILVIRSGDHADPESCQLPVSNVTSSLVLEEGQVKTKLDTLSDLIPLAKQNRRLRLEVLELERVNLAVPVLQRAVDWSIVTTLTLLHCDSHEQLWKAFRRTYTPRLISTTPVGSSQPGLRRNSHVSVGNSSTSGSDFIPSSEYRLSLRRLHTNTVSSALIAFLKETLAPNSLETLFLQDGGLVNSNGALGRCPYDSIVTVDSIYRGPLRRHRLSLKKVLIDSTQRARDSAKWRKWKLDRDALSYVTSGKMSALREISCSLDYKDWHFFLQRLPQVPHIRSIHVPNVADHIYGHRLVEKELALQVVDIIALRPEIELCYLGLAYRCFEIMEGTYNSDATVTFRDPATSGPVASPGSIIDSDEESEEDEVEEDEEDATDGGLHDSDSASENDSFGESDAEVERERGRKEIHLKLREILFYDEKVSIFKARHGKL